MNVQLLNKTMEYNKLVFCGVGGGGERELRSADTGENFLLSFQMTLKVIIFK